MLSIIIVNWNTRDLLVACLKSIFAYPPSREFEVIVVDNQSSDQSAEAVRSQYPQAVLIEPGRNTGYAAGNNLGFGEATGELLLTLNPDTEVLPDTLERACEILESRSAYGVLSCKLIGTDQLTQQSVRDFPTAQQIAGEATALAKLLPKSKFAGYRSCDFDYTTEGPAPQPMGTFLLFKRSALEAVGDARSPFDESFPIFFNEVDLLKRLSDRGFPCLYTPKISVLHHGGMSTRQVRKSMIWESHRSVARYLEKHRQPGDAFWLAVLKPLLWLGALIRAKGTSEGFRS